MVDGYNLMSSQSNAIYQWVDCNNGNAPLAGATDQQFTPTFNGSYAVEVTRNGCSATSACHSIIITGFDENDNKIVYLNPSNEGAFSKDLGAYYQNIKGRIQNSAGKAVLNSEHHHTQFINVQVPGPSSIYFIRL